MKLKSTLPLTQLLIQKNITSWDEATSYVQQLPYGRNKNRTDVSLIVLEEKGSCSSKHAFLKQLAIENDFIEVKLILGIYKMDANNTNGIGNTLKKSNLDYIPEAHCYLKKGDSYFDYTSVNSDFTNFKNDILEESEIQLQQVANYKVRYHKKYLKNWVTENNIPYNFEEIWNIREACILKLSQ